MTGASLLNFFFNPAFSLLPILVTKHFGGGAMQLGWLESAVGIGTIAGGLGLGVWGGFKRRIVTSFAGILIASATMVGIGFTSAGALFLGIGFVFVTGVALSMANAPIIAVIQSVVPRDMQGRVFTLIGALAAAMSPLGLAIAGPVTDAIGMSAWYFIAGGAGLAMGIAAYFIPALMNIEQSGQKANGKQVTVPASVTTGAALPNPVKSRE